MDGDTSTATPTMTDDQAAPATPNTSSTPPASSPAASPSTPQIPPANRAAASPVSVVPQKDVVKPAKRGGLAGVMDELADAIAGTQGSARIYKDKEGNEYIEHPTLSRKQQWLKIAGEAVRGAAAGAAAKPGPGQLGRAAEAGVNAGDQMADRARQQDQQTQQQARQDNQDRFNSIMLKMKIAEQQFELAHKGAQADEGEIKFNQEQNDRMQKMVGEGQVFDRGVYADQGAVSKVQEQDAQFWKNVHGKDAYEVVPEIGADGSRHGIHLYQWAQPDERAIPKEGLTFQVYEPDGKGTGKMTEHRFSGLATEKQAAAYSNAARKQQMDEAYKYAEIQEKQANADKKEGSPLDEEVKKSTINKNNAEASAANARATKDREGGASKPQNMVFGSLPDGRQVAGTAEELQAAGVRGVMKLGQEDQKKVLASRELLAPDGLFALVNQDIRSLDAQGKIGVAASRWNDFMTSKVGSDPEYAPLRTHMGLLASLLMQAHVGSRSSHEMLEHFKSLADYRISDAKTLRAALGAEYNYIRGRAMLAPQPSGGQ